jgi:hypothetical protein
VGMKNLPRGAVAAAQNAPLYGTVIFNLVEETPPAVAAALDGDTSMGLPVGFLTDLPTFNVSRETVDITGSIAGLGVRLKGSELLLSEEGSVELAFASISVENLKRALPGLRDSAWNSDTNASRSVGTGNAQHTVRALASGAAGNALSYAIVVPATANAVASVTVTGAAGSETITFNTATNAATTPASTSTANDAIRLINEHATAKKLVQAGRPKTSDGSAVVTAAAAATLAGGAPGTRIGDRLKSGGSWTLSDYIRTVHVIWESVNTNVAHMARIDNAISMDDFSFQGDDGGAMSGISMTMTATASEEDYDSNTGRYRGPFSWLKLDDVAS